MHPSADSITSPPASEPERVIVNTTDTVFPLEFGRRSATLPPLVETGTPEHGRRKAGLFSAVSTALDLKSTSRWASKRDSYFQHDPQR